MNLVFIMQPGSCTPQASPRPPTSDHWVPLSAYAAAAVAGGVGTAATLAWLGEASRGLPFLGTAAGIAVVIAAIAGIAADLTGHADALPQRRRQVPRSWVDRRSRIACAIGFGFMLGAACFTYLHRGSTYVLAALAVLAPSLAAGILLGVAYGFGRALPVLIDAWSASQRKHSKPVADWFGQKMSYAVAFASAAVLVLWLPTSLGQGGLS